MMFADMINREGRSLAMSAAMNYPLCSSHENPQWPEIYGRVSEPIAST